MTDGPNGLRGTGTGSCGEVPDARATHGLGHIDTRRAMAAQNERAPSFYASAMIGAAAGAASKTATAPVERVRLLLQMSTTTASSSATRAVLQKEGASGLWRGNGLAVTRAMVQKGLLFSTQDRLRVMIG